MKRTSYICKAITAIELSEKLVKQGYAFTPERLIDLAEAEYLPHIMIDGNDIRFKTSDALDWIKKNLIQHKQARPFPKPFPVVVSDKPTTDGLPNILYAFSENIFEYRLNEIPPCVYFLCEGNSVVYVGQSINFHLRMAEHNNTKKFNRVYFLPVPRGDMIDIETAFIKYMKPKYNHGPTHGRLVLSSAITEERYSEILEFYHIDRIISDINDKSCEN